MSETIIPPVAAPALFEQLVDSEGRLVLLPSAFVHHLRRTGRASITLNVAVIVDAIPRRAWLSISDAARLHVNDIDGLKLGAARISIVRAIESGAITVEGGPRRRRIDPTSFDAWRLAQRERDLEREDG